MANTIERVHPSAHSSPQPIRQMDCFSRFAQLMAEHAYTLQWAHLSTRIAPSHGDHLDLPCNTWCFPPKRVHNQNGTSIGSAVFAQMTAECLYTLQWLGCFPLKLSLPMLASGPHLILGSFGPHKSATQMATWSLQPFLQAWQTERATERPTDHATQCDVLLNSLQNALINRMQL